ncbi:MAG: hypothetical protein NUW37_04290 [Planctomycetes bacterium]|nr:hypothetical protein [Planctomycetota bacterium]
MIRFTLIVNCLATLMVSTMVLWFFIDGTSIEVESIHPTLAWLLFPGYQSVVVALALLLLVFNIVALVQRFKELRDQSADRYLVLKALDGKESVSLLALKESLQRCAKSMREIAGAKVLVKRDKYEPSVVNVFVEYWAYERQNLADAETHLREALRFRFHEIVKPEHGVQVSYFLRLRGIKDDRPSPFAPIPSKAKQKVKDIFKGPVYPGEK